MLDQAATPAQLPPGVGLELGELDVVVVECEVGELLGGALGDVVGGAVGDDVGDVGIDGPPHALTVMQANVSYRSTEASKVYPLAAQSPFGMLLGVEAAHHLACQMYLSTSDQCEYGLRADGPRLTLRRTPVVLPCKQCPQRTPEQSTPGM